MKVVILAGGFGSRLGEYTHLVPKPMLEVGGLPIIFHIMKWYSNFGINEFILALGYKSQVVKDFFLNFRAFNSDISVDLKNGVVTFHEGASIDWKVTLVETGLNTMTGGRLLRVKEHLQGEDFMLTYGDGLADVDIDELLNVHKSRGLVGTVTAVRPSARFGELEMAGNLVTRFREKPQTKQGWINGGFFVFKNSFLEMIHGDETVLERAPLEQLADAGELMAYKHKGFWQCMDTKRDHDFLEELVSSGNTPWIR